MLLPLGLGFNFRRFPIVTILLVTLCCVIYFSHPERSAEDLKQIQKILDEEKVTAARADLFVDYCISQGGDPHVCRTLAQVGSNKKSDDRDNDAAEDKLFNGENLSDSLHDSLFYVTLALDFGKQIKKTGSAIRGLASYAPYSHAYQQAQVRLGDFYTAQGLLSPANLHLIPALTSQFCHSSFGHLAGNMFFLLLFGAYVEQRIGPLLYLTTYLLGGFTGLFLEAYLSHDSLFYLVGASANISAIMGIFFVLYFRFKMKFMVWFMTLKTFYAPVALIFPILYIGQEFLSGVTGLDDVAHFAHLGGLAVGAYLAFLWDSFNLVPWPFISTSECRAFNAIKNLPFEEKLKAGLKLLSFNSQNMVIRQYLISETFLQCQKSEQNSAELVTFLKTNLDATIHDLPKESQITGAATLLKNCPSTLKLQEIWSPSDKSIALRIGDSFLRGGEVIEALKFYDFFLRLAPRSQKTGDVIKTGLGILAYTASEEALNRQWEEYIRFNGPSPLAQAFSPKSGGLNDAAAAAA